MVPVTSRWLMTFSALVRSRTFLHVPDRGLSAKSGEVVHQQSPQHAVVPEKMRVGERVKHALVGGSRH